MTEKIDDLMPPVEYITEDYKGANKLKDKRVLITGGDSGIGRAVALHVAREGARVAILYHSDEDSARKTREGIEAEGAEALVLQGDTADSTSCTDTVNAVVAKWGGIDVLVNNAGLQKPYASQEDISDDDWRMHFAVNMDGIFYTTRAALNHMGEGASIINTTSINAFVGNADLVPYTATKGAIVGYTRALALQLIDRGIRVNEVAPGPVATEIQLVFKDYDEDMLKNMASPMGRMGQPYELGPAYVFLACRDSSFVTGQTLHVNGGMIANG
ncbi:SDR family oxidoreductase [Acuticoccus sp. MNP-M23]|uniref:SDR family oxidoreductase n=1 Tax=Acuticoccus sp. MNP-M23 TaxID=3072793 RepID=UPI002814A029|nr:SDR family oxidoreductase [Acuticoccus sp. MNP-M23]WMS41859.1 SDR family oxidoreductase [Acuticoccus sp. MNP-M23]